MPRSRSIDSYPESFWKIVEDAATKKQTFEFPFKDRLEGVQLQGKFYGFRGALKREALRLAVLLPADNPKRLRAETAAVQIQQIVCHVDRVTGTTKIMHRDETPEAKMFEEALLRAGSQTRDQELSEAAKRFITEQQMTKDNPTGGKYG